LQRLPIEERSATPPPSPVAAEAECAAAV